MAVDGITAKFSLNLTHDEKIVSEMDASPEVSVTNTF